MLLKFSAPLINIEELSTLTRRLLLYQDKTTFLRVNLVRNAWWPFFSFRHHHHEKLHFDGFPWKRFHPFNDLNSKCFSYLIFIKNKHT